jgi:hypothetical protein
MSATLEDADVQPTVSRYNTVMLIPVMGGNGKIQNRILLLDRPPTKEFAIQKATELHAEYAGRKNYANEWSRCADVFKQVPEELFAHLYQRRTTSITYLVTVSTRDGLVNRMFSARLCMVHSVPPSSL